MKVLPFKLPTTSSQSFLVQIDEEPHLYDTFHSHPEVQIMLILESEGNLICGDYIGNFQPGDLYVTGPDLPHVFRNNKEYYKGDKNLKAKAISIFFNDNVIGEGFLDLPEMEVLKGFIAKSVRGIHFNDTVCKKVGPLIKSIDKDKGLERYIRLLQILKILSESKEYDFLCTDVEMRNYGEKEGKRMDQVLKFILSEYYREITLKEISELANMTPNAFCRYFKQHTRKTYINFLNDIRIANACKTLKTSEESIAQIGYQNGFNNLSNFNRTFKKSINMSPSTYRKAYLQ
ncbi:MAG: helix-turn-helix transcriptional regulator [Flavobacteriales bacterium]|nr:helix-turn-helix transcriptional regulator [Flavobacteriales bacterium]